MEIRDIRPEDAVSCLEIYNYYIEHSAYTLEYDTLSPEEFSARVEKISSAYPYVVCEDDGKILGYAYLDPFGVRKGYRYTADVAIYVEKESRGKGIGKKMMKEILIRAENRGIRDVIAVVTEENTASLAFHKSMGFKVAGRFEGIAEKFDRRFGVVYMQKKLS